MENVQADVASCVMCRGADGSIDSPLQRLLPPGLSRFVAQTPRLVALPTVGAFVPGYLLIVPRAHVLSFGHLDTATLAEADDLIAALVARLAASYGLPVLAFEYGHNVPGGRRVEHAHWHLLPSTADIRRVLDARIQHRRIDSLTALPRGTDESYMAVRDQYGVLTVYPVRDTPDRVRLRRLVADLDPRIDPNCWDWAEHRFIGLVRQTVTDLARDTDGAES